MIKSIEHLPTTILVIFALILMEGINANIIFFCLLFGWLVDLDHLIDFLIINKKKDLFNFNLFISGSYFQKSQKIYIFLHSYEITLLLLISSIIVEQNIFYVALAHFFHLLQDQITNKVKNFSYFFIYRLLNNFSIKAVCS